MEKNILNETIHIAVKELKSRYDIAKDILEPFGIPVIAIDSQDTAPVTTDSLDMLEKLHVPQYSYEEIIGKILEEIEHREVYSFII